MSTARSHVTVEGVVQGVGFRPFVYRLAMDLELTGWVLNTSGSVEIEVEGPAHRVAAFTRRLRDDAPPLSWIKELRALDVAPAGGGAFEIRESAAQEGAFQPISPDIATCQDCRRELFDPADRRSGYPFTNCTNCGPRYTIIRDVPYDRPLTTMAPFPLCPDCRAEFDDPLDRRFHAQPNACPACGPRVVFHDRAGVETPAEPLGAAAALLERGGVLALKGLGGFHLACDATRPEAVALLRSRKGRGGKPFAVMLPDLDTLRRHCRPSETEVATLTSPQAPIVLIPWERTASDICDDVGPGLLFLGVMLPYTPLHHLLMARLGRPLVMTSGNLSEEPIARDNAEALERLGALADGFLLHDREILARCDDSVYFVEGGAPRPIRRARGHAPHPVVIKGDGPQVLAVGAQEKSTFTLVRGEHGFVSPHIGDLENLETLTHFRDTEARYEHLFRVRPEVIAHDLHPDYLSTAWALERAASDEIPAVACQHHHAHVVSCMADAGYEEPVIGVSFDGTGYGTDGAIWGGEVLVATRAAFRRALHLEYVPLPGGAASIRRPGRMAASYLFSLLEPDEAAAALHRTGLGPGEAGVVEHMIRTGLNAPRTSSMGRLFDGVAALCGLGTVASYEGEAAIRLEMAAHRAPMETGTYPLAPSSLSLPLAPLFRAVLHDLDAGVDIPIIARRFHNSVAALTSQAACHLREVSGIKAVALTGGVFQNRLLTRLAGDTLAGDGFTVLLHRQVPCNDGGISLGQAVIARHPTDVEVP
ncbi:MAG: carbamoyltransferase HypF [Pseudomonadota bacterium]